MAALQDKFGVAAIDTYIVSMTQSKSDLLAILLFAKEGTYSLEKTIVTISVVPLFETIEDLQNAPKLFQSLLQVVYKNHIKQRNNVQEVMTVIPTGKMAASSPPTGNSPYAKSPCRIARAEGIRLRLFHGRAAP